MGASPVALVLLPGMDGSGSLFAGFVAALGDAVVPLVLSYPPSQQLGYQALLDVTLAQLPPGQPFVLLGESFSGPVAIAIAAARPADLIGVVLSCTFARNPLPQLRRLGALVSLLPISGKLTALAEPLLLGRHATPALRQALRSALERVPAATLRARLREVLAVDYSVQARSIVVPVLYLQAAQDRLVPASAARHLASLLPSMTVTAFRGPHLLLQAMPEEAADRVRAFVRETCAQRPVQPGR